MTDRPQYEPVDAANHEPLDASVEINGDDSKFDIVRERCAAGKLKRTGSFYRFQSAAVTVTKRIQRNKRLRRHKDLLSRGFVAADDDIDLREKEFDEWQEGDGEDVAAPAWWNSDVMNRCLRTLDYFLIKNLIRGVNLAALLVVAYIGFHAKDSKHSTAKKRFLISTAGYFLVAFSGFMIHDGIMDCMRPLSGGVAFLYRDKNEADMRRKITPAKQKKLFHWRFLTVSLAFFMISVIVWHMMDIAWCLGQFSGSGDDSPPLLEWRMSHATCSETLSQAPSGLATSRELADELCRICYMHLFVICPFWIWYYGFLFPIFVQSLQLGSALADDAVQDLARTLFAKNDDGKHVATQLSDDEWDRNVHQPAIDLARITMPALSFWGPSVGSFLITNIMNALFQLPTIVNTYYATGRLDRPMNLVQFVIVVIAMQVALVPAAVSTSCDVLNDQLNELRSCGGKLAHDRALVIETFFARLNRQQGLGFTVYSLVVDKIVLKKIVALVAGSGGALFTLLATYSLDQNPHKTVGGALEVDEYFLNVTHNDSALLHSP